MQCLGERLELESLISDIYRSLSKSVSRMAIPPNRTFSRFTLVRVNPQLSSAHHLVD